MHWLTAKMLEVFSENQELALDIGCGKKRWDSWYKCPYIGIDTYKESKADIFARGGWLPFKENSFSFVTMFSVLEYIEKDEDVLREIHRVLKPKGTLIISTHKKAIDFLIIPTIITKFYNLWNKIIKAENIKVSEYIKQIPIVTKAINKSVELLKLKEIEKIPYLYYLDPFWGRLLGKKINILFKFGNLIQKLPLSYYKNLKYLIYQKQ